MTVELFPETTKILPPAKCVVLGPSQELLERIYNCVAILIDPTLSLSDAVRTAAADEISDFREKYPWVRFE